jgi:hypothetical protein
MIHPLVEVSSFEAIITHNEYVPQGKFRVPIPLQGIDAHMASVLFDIWMPYPSAECGSWRAFRIVGRNGEAKLPEAFGVRSSLWAGQ